MKAKANLDKTEAEEAADASAAIAAAVAIEATRAADALSSAVAIKATGTVDTAAVAEATAEAKAIAGAKGHYGLILYDGVCGLCNRFVKIVLDNDSTGRFQFASLQSNLARTLLTSMGKDPTVLKSIYLVKGLGTDSVTVLAKAEAAVDIFGQLDGPIRNLKFLSILPVWLLNPGYDLIAANRYRIFGRREACPMPNPAHLKRFLDQ